MIGKSQNLVCCFTILLSARFSIFIDSMFYENIDTRVQKLYVERSNPLDVLYDKHRLDSMHLSLMNIPLWSKLPTWYIETFTSKLKCELLMFRWNWFHKRNQRKDDSLNSKMVFDNDRNDSISVYQLIKGTNPTFI